MPKSSFPNKIFYYNAYVSYTDICSLVQIFLPEQINALKDYSGYVNKPDIVMENDVFAHDPQQVAVSGWTRAKSFRNMIYPRILFPLKNLKKKFSSVLL